MWDQEIMTTVSFRRFVSKDCQPLPGSTEIDPNELKEAMEDLKHEGPLSGVDLWSDEEKTKAELAASIRRLHAKIELQEKALSKEDLQKVFKTDDDEEGKESDDDDGLLEEEAVWLSGLEGGGESEALGDFEELTVVSGLRVPASTVRPLHLQVLGRPHHSLDSYSMVERDLDTTHVYLFEGEKTMDKFEHSCLNHHYPATGPLHHIRPVGMVSLAAAPVYGR